MEIVKREEMRLTMVRSNRIKARNAKMSLEDYMEFVESLNYSDFSINYLNQIIAMHGYKKIHKTVKVILISAMSSIALMSPCRSTLNDKISPSECETTLESVTGALNELGWQECTITSVESIDAVKLKSAGIGSSSSAACGGGGGAQPVPKKRRGKPSKEERKRRALKPKKNAVVCAPIEGRRKKKKKECGCSGCVSRGPCLFVG